MEFKEVKPLSKSTRKKRIVEIEMSQCRRPKFPFLFSSLTVKKTVAAWPAITRASTSPLSLSNYLSGDTVFSSFNSFWDQNRKFGEQLNWDLLLGILHYMNQQGGN